MKYIGRKYGLAAASLSCATLMLTGTVSAVVAAPPVVGPAPVTYDQAVSRPFVSDSTLKIKKRVGTNIRVSVRSIDTDTVRLVSTKPVTVKMTLVRTGRPGMVQSDTRSVRVTAKGVDVTNLLSGRTYLVRHSDAKQPARITPMKRINSISGLTARFGVSPLTAVVDASHVRDWASGADNVAYTWLVRSYQPLAKSKNPTVIQRNSAPVIFSAPTPISEATVDLPKSGYVHIQVTAVNLLGFPETASFYSLVPVEDAWEAGGAGGSLFISSTPPVLTVSPARVVPAPGVSVDSAALAASGARDKAVGFANAAQGFANDSAKAASASRAAMNVGDAELAASSTALAWEAKNATAAQVVLAKAQLKLISVDLYPLLHAEASAAVLDAAGAAADARVSSVEATSYAVEAWRDEAVRALNTLVNGHAALTGSAADAFATLYSDRSVFAASEAAREATRLDPVKDQVAADAASLIVTEADEASAAAVAVANMVFARGNVSRAAVTASTSAVADGFAADARSAANAARVAADATVSGSTYDVIAEQAAFDADAFADAAELAAADVRFREIVQAQRDIAVTAAASATATATATESRVFLVTARNAVATALAALNSVTLSSDELPAAQAAYDEAVAAALSVEAFSLASQALLDSAVVFQDNATVELGGANTTFTFNRNPADTRFAIEYVVTANRGGVSTTGVLSEVAGVITVTFPVINGNIANATTFTITASSYGERTSANPTTYAPSAPSAASLFTLSGMTVATTGNNVCAESGYAPGVLEGASCVTTLPLTYDTRPYTYATQPLQYNTTTGVVGSVVLDIQSNAGGDSRFGSWGGHPNGWYSCTGGNYCTYGYNIYGVTSQTLIPVSGFTSNGSVWVSNTQQAPPTSGANIDPTFSDTGFTDSNGTYVAVSPRPASLNNITSFGVLYSYSPSLNLYVASTAPDVYDTFRPTFLSLPASVISWSDGTVTYSGLSGGDTGRIEPTITVNTLGGPVSFTSQDVNSNSRRP